MEGAATNYQQKQVTLSFSHHKDRLAEQVTLTMTSTTYSDVNFIVDGQTIHCHKNIMASGCEYFHELFQGQFKDCTEIPISTMSFDLFNTIKKFIYTGKLKLSIESSFDLLEIALEIGYNDLRKVLEHFFAKQFQEVVKSKKYLNLSKAAIKYVLAHEDLNVSSEELVCTHFLKWVEHAPEERYKCINQLLLSLRLACLTPEFIQYNLLMHPSVMRNTDAVEKLHWMLRHVLFNDVVPPFVESQLPRTKTKECDGLVIINMSDKLKVMYFGIKWDCIQLQRQENRPLKQNFEMKDSTGRVIKIFGIKPDHIQPVRQIYEPLKHEFDMKEAQACVFNNTVYAASNSFNFMKLDMTMLDYTCSSAGLTSSSNFILVAGKSNELVLIKDMSLERYCFLQNKWISVVNPNIPTFSFVKTTNAEWYLRDTEEYWNEKTYGALIDSGVLYIFGAKHDVFTEGGSSDAVNILRVCFLDQQIYALEMTLPQPVKHMEVMAYKEHVILAGSDNTYIIRLEDLRKCPKAGHRDDTRHDIGPITGWALLEEQRTEDDLDSAQTTEGAIGSEQTTDDKFKPSMKNLTQVVTSKLQGSNETAFKMCRVGNQLIKLEAMVSNRQITRLFHKQKVSYITEFKYETFWAANIEEVIANAEGIHWRKIGEIPGDLKQMLQTGDFVLVPLKFSKEQ